MSRLFPAKSFFTIAVTLVCPALPAMAHSAEQGFILLLPTDIYITAGTLAVVASILLVSILSHRNSRQITSTIRVKGLRLPSVPGASLASSLIIFGLIWIGLTGPRDPLANLLPLAIWTVWWIGLVACLPIFGNIWASINPWVGLYGILTGDRNPPFRIPKSFGIWPGVAIFLAFHIFAIADIAPSDPNRLAIVVGGYWAFTLVGMILFGGTSWLTQAECFTILFKLLASLAPLQKSRLGIPGWALLKKDYLTLSHTAFCIVILGAGSFDGLHETFWWLAQIGINPLEFPGRSAVVWTSTFGLITTCVTLAFAFFLSVWAGSTLAKPHNIPLSRSIPMFALCLVPIAFGYHFAHYLTSFLVGIQYSVITLSDPFATGANYFGTAKLQVTTGFLNDPGTVKIIWLVQAFAVVISHILAVIMTHATAAKLYQDRTQILLAQSALSLLMIAYTVFGLWLLASPRGV
jgi:hypothetical protein